MGVERPALKIGKWRSCAYFLCEELHEAFPATAGGSAALGLLASGANAAELNINGVSDYAASADQVTSVTQFSDVYPTDWAYQALANLVETYGCVAGYPNGTFRGNRAMTRYEAAALLNACLDRITEVTDELRRLLKEFETELAILKGRVDGLEARVGELEATQFSTTKLKGVTNWVFGAASFNDEGSDVFSTTQGGTSLSYNLALNLETSFTGKDLLYTRLRAGNMNNVFSNAFAQEYGFDSDNSVVVNRLYYSFPVGDEFTVVGGPMVRMDDMLPVWPSAYPSDMTYDFFTYAGAPGAYNLALGAGAGVYWKSNDFSVSASYMKLFQQLLVAPAALGLMASGANAAELNINGVSDYAASADQVTSVTQFSDVYPTDWAYQALANLVETYGCVAGYPNGTFRGNRAMTRYEAAALLNACLDRITEVTDELRRLLKEFETELAILKGRVDGLEAKRWRTASSPVLHHHQAQRC